MLKFLAWRRPPLHILTLNSFSFLSLSPFLFCHYHSIKQCISTSPPPEDPHDPPFSPISKTMKHKKKDSKTTFVPFEDHQDLPFQSDLPFDFRYSYSETNPSIKPISFREPPRFSPFGPGRLDRKWTGTSAPAERLVDPETVEENRNSLLGEPLTEEEIEELVEKYRHSDCSRQINLG